MGVKVTIPESFPQVPRRPLAARPGGGNFNDGPLMRLLLTLGLLLALAPPLAAQRDSVLATRWVGNHEGRPLQFEFYGDTMLVVNDLHALDYRLTGDSLVAFGDTIIQGRYRLVRDWLLFETPSGMVTMAK